VPKSQNGSSRALPVVFNPKKMPSWSPSGHSFRIGGQLASTWLKMAYFE